MTDAATALQRAARGWQAVLDSPSPLLKQAPTAIAVLIAAVLTAAMPALHVIDAVATYLGIATVFAATLYAAVLSARGHHDGWLVLLIPTIDIIGVGMFRVGTGGAASMFSSLILLPVVWLAGAAGIRYVFLVAALTSFAMLMPYLLAPATSSVEWIRGIISPLVFAAVAAVVNELTRQQRARTRQAEQLVAERTAALTDNVRIVEQLRESEVRYRELLDTFESLWEANTAQALVGTDLDGHVVAWNPGAVRLLGLSEKDALDGVHVSRFVPAHSLRALAQEHLPTASPHLSTTSEHSAAAPMSGTKALLALVEADDEIDIAVDILTAAGSQFPARVTVNQRSDGSGAHRGYLIIITDETRMAEVVRMKDEFVGMISHELRTPLSSIIGFLDLLQNDPAQPLSKDQEEFVAVIERNARRLLNLVGDLLLTAQVASGVFPLERSEADLVAIVQAAVASAGPHADREGIELVVDAPRAAIMMAVDSSRFGQAIDNLISNAIKFTRRGGKVTARVDVVDGAVIVAIRDTGIGIPKDEQGMLFTKFFRASTATRDAVPGVGLGLMITRAIVIAHGGEMDVDSEEGVGTEFRLVFPRGARTESITVTREGE